MRRLNIVPISPLFKLITTESPDRRTIGRRQYPRTETVFATEIGTSDELIRFKRAYIDKQPGKLIKNDQKLIKVEKLISTNGVETKLISELTNYLPQTPIP